jgi:hypothetical protein
MPCGTSVPSRRNSTSMPVAPKLARVLFTGRANLKDLAIRSGSSARNMSSRLCDSKRMTAMMQRRSAQLHASLTFPSFRRRFRLFTVRARGWSTTGLQSSARSGDYCSIVGSQWRRALRERVVPEILADTTNELTALAREAISELYDLFRDLIGVSPRSTRRSIEYSSKVSHPGASPP